MKEMDLILGPYADTHLAGMDAAGLETYDALLNENDQELLPMVLGQALSPPRFAPLIADIGAFARARLTPKE